MPKPFNDSKELRKAFNEEIERERNDQLMRLGFTLALVGVSIEILVFVISYFISERVVRPVEESYEKQREFIANASHELKTPLASIRANFEALGATEQPWADNVESELSRASNLVNDLLILARTDGRSEESKKRNVDIAKLVRERAKLVEARLGEKKLNINTNDEEFAHINEADFTQVLDILLDNAVKYSKKKIEINVSESGVSVANDGKTITAEKLNKIFDRFYQIDKTSEGSGLGLSIAKAISDQNKWRIIAESGKNETKFSVLF